ncbi:MAG: hypothetical protein L6263_00515 [Desulfobacteraceae bacterium]|nr:hypothetical protein [Pseudomonadota bacterium]MCG2756903.1 hypothetical protein [Desulfobacteraceae bacterium]
MKNSRITYHKERTRREFKEMVAVQRNIIEKYIILLGSFLMISDAFKQFPALNLITPEAPLQIVCYIMLKYYRASN